MKLFVYQLFCAVAGLTAWPLFYHHLKSRGQGESFPYRLGLKPPPLPPPGAPRLWLHGVSVGEILAAAPLVAELRTQLPAGALVVSTGTETGQAVARRQFLPQGAQVCYFPLDLPWAVQRALTTLQPEVFVALESEVWPTFLSTARRRGVRLGLMNARLSDRSFRRYQRAGKFLGEFLDLFETIAAGSQEDRRRLAALGLDPRKLVFTGNLKVDALLARRGDLTHPPSPSLAHRLALTGEPVLLAASTHAGEEEVVLTAYEALRGPYPSLRLILVPRHPERAPAVEDLLARHGLGSQRWSALKDGAGEPSQPVVLVDTVGDLFNLYGLADVAFVGGSLVPHGGQNILEPAVWGLSPLYGPHWENFRWAEEILREAGLGAVVHDAPSLAAATRQLLADPEGRRRRGKAALAALEAHRGAARRQAQLILSLVKKSPPPH